MSDGEEVRGELRFKASSELRSPALQGIDPRQLALLLEGLQARPQRTFGEVAAEWHAARAKTLVEAGCSPLAMKVVLGWSRKAQLEDTYVHLTFPFMKAEVEKLDLLGGSSADGGAWGPPHGGKEIDAVGSDADDAAQAPQKESQAMPQDSQACGREFKSHPPLSEDLAPREYISTGEFAAQLKKLGLELSGESVRKRCDRGEIRSVRLGGNGNHRIPRTELSRFLRDSGVEVAP